MYSRKTKPDPRTGEFREPKVRFVIVGNPRTGSSHLVSLLDSHPDIACWNGEIFNAGQAFDHSPYDDPRVFLNETVFRVNADAVGFKLLWGAMNRAPDTWEWLKQLNIRIVHTCRANLLDSFISHRLASINNAFTSSHGEYKMNRFDAPYGQCLEWFETVSQRDEEIRKKSAQGQIPRIEIEYRELCAQQDRVLEFLEVSPHPLISRLKKQRNGSQVEILTNYAELKEKFAGTRWSQYFCT